MALWRNLGAPFQGVGTGETFQASPDDSMVVRRRYKLELVDGADADVGWVEYPGIDFGSDRAYEVARDSDPPLTLDELSEITGSGQEGALLVSDVQRAVDERGDDDAE